MAGKSSMVIFLSGIVRFCFRRRDLHLAFIRKHCLCSLVNLGDPIFARNSYRCERWVFPSWIGSVWPSLDDIFFDVTEVLAKTILVMILPCSHNSSAYCSW
jgi:hypothetical protein